MDRLRKYLAEILIIAIGLGAGLLEVFLLKDNNLAALIVIISFLLSIAVLTIRQEVETQIAQQLEIHRIIQQIPSEDWRREAENRLQHLKLELQGWAEGRRSLNREQALSYQIGLVRRAKRKVQAIHIGMPIERLLLWDRTHGPFSRLLENYRRLGRGVLKQRLFICSRDDLFDGDILNQRILQVWKQQIQPPEEGGYGFEARVLWASSYVKEGEMPPDMLLVDDEQAVVLTGSGSPQEHYEAVTNPTLLERYKQLFSSLWEVSEPIESYLERDTA